MATVCVCIPTRNRADYARRALASVLGQSTQDFRVIVSDDASDPAAAREVELNVAGLADCRVSYRFHPDNLREYEHGRFLFTQCSEEFFSILHDDDLWEPTFLERCLDVLRADPSLACVTTDQTIIDARGAPNPEMTSAYRRRMGRDRYPEGRLPILEPLLTHSLFALSSTVFRSAALERSGLVDPGLQGNAIFDINLFLRLGERNEAAYYLPEALAAYRIHEDRLTVSEERGGLNGRLLETFIAVLEKRHFSGRAERERRRHLSAAYRNYAVICYLRHDPAGFYRHLRKCVTTSPWRYQSWASLGFAAFPFLVRPVFGSRVLVEPSP
jgi:glycosyltransferase involved in cell wall biosynthesis